MRTMETVQIENYSLCYRTDSHDRSIIEEVWEKGAYSKHFRVGKRAVILDIGGHNGYFAVYAAHNTAEGSRIYCYEPMTDNFAILVENLKRNRVDKVEARQCCIGAVDGTLTMYVNSAHTGGHSQYRERIEKYHLDHIEEVSCPCIALEHAVPADVREIDYCKIDCEGAEFDILLKAPPEFLKKIAVYAMEFHEFGGHKVGELIELFEKLGYTVTHSFTPSKLGISFGELLAVRN